jgi:hypothetical protein
MRSKPAIGVLAALGTAAAMTVVPIGLAAPAGATPFSTQEVTFEVSGAQGGGGGGGGVVTATQTMNVGDTASLFVGTSSGSNGGGAGSWGGGSGGGASDVRLGGTGLSDRVIVAGGGGGRAGGGQYDLYVGGGAGGGSGDGSGGGTLYTPDYHGGFGGGGGTQASGGGGGGTGPLGGCGGAASGGAGVLGVGGDGGAGNGAGGGGGGGGVYGGGGGGGSNGCGYPGGGGGGGSGYVSSAFTVDSSADGARGGDGAIRISLDHGLTWAATFATDGTYAVPPHPDPTAVTPLRVAADAGHSLVISGNNLDSVDGVTVGGLAANFTYAAGELNVTWLSAIPLGTNTVQVHSTTGGPPTQDLTVEAYRTPAVTSGTPSYLNAAGGTAVTIDGTELLGSAVTIGGTSVTASVTDTQVTFVAPAHAVGPVVASLDNGDASTTTGFTYDTAPVVAGITPGSGPIAGGNSLVISGSHFAATPVVVIGGNNTTITNATATELTVTAPAHAVGTVAVTVTTNLGNDATTYTYLPAPAGTVTPEDGPITGGSAVITGTDLTGGTATVDGAAASSTLNGNGSATVTMPPHAAGSVPLVWTTNGGELSLTYTYWGAPTIDTTTPPAGPTSGGDVTLTGSGYDAPGLAVTINGQPASVSAQSPTSLTVTAPAANAGQVPVVVTTVGGTASSTFSYVNAPTVDGPVTTRLAGGSVVLGGSNLGDATVTVDGASVPVTADTATSLTFTAAAHAAGDVAIVVTTVGGSTSTTLQYVSAPTLTSASTTMLDSGNTTTTLTGTNLSNPQWVTINGQWAAVLQSSPTSVVVSVPSLLPGRYLVELSTVGGTVSASGLYTVTEPASVTVSDSTVSAGSTITATLRGFDPGGTVTLELHSQPVALGSVIAGPDGRAILTVTIPNHTEPGWHFLSASGLDAGNDAVTVVASVIVSPGWAPVRPAQPVEPAVTTVATAATVPTAATAATGSQLPYTGFDFAKAGLLGPGAISVGFALILLSRRRRRSAS